MDLETTTAEPGVTAAIVQRVCDRLGTGVPLALALAGEPVSEAEYEAHLREHPELAALDGVAKRKFLQEIIGVLLSAKDSSSNIRWLLERLYPDVFGRERERKRDQAELAVNLTTIAGMSEEEVRLLREDAKRL